MLEILQELTQLAEEKLMLLALVFTRVGATVALLPGFGEQTIPTRIRLGMTVAMTMLTWPLLIPLSLPSFDLWGALPLFATEGLIGLFFGISVRLILMALQFAGSIASQSTSLAQIMGAAGTPDPMPAIGNILVISGITLALVTDLHIKAVAMMAYSYQILPIGDLPDARDVAEWGMRRSTSAFALGFTLAGPFLIASFAYNLTIGIINRAMPQLMVAFIGAPAITAGGILLLFLAAPLMLMVFNERLDVVLSNPFEVDP